ncbi:MAG TPA: FMN-binding protein [Bacillales bacterium]|nr:FMN-binding protein [Bacillales bacterium]
MNEIEGNDMAKMDKKWIILCSTAIAAIYTAGYVSTGDQAVASIQPNQQVQMDIPSNGNQSNQNWQSGNVTENSQSHSIYQDGIYVGMGSNRRGSIEVTVTIQNDKITDVEIRNHNMHYPQYYTDGLPDEVLQSQSARVQNVSGATYSTDAFKDAVQDALNQAQIS